MRFEHYDTDNPDVVVREAAKRYLEQLQDAMADCSSRGQVDCVTYMREEHADLQTALGETK